MFTIEHIMPMLIAAVVGLVAWVWGLWQSHNAHKLHVAEEYVKRHHLDPIYAELKYLRNMSLKIARAMRIDVSEEEHE